VVIYPYAINLAVKSRGAASIGEMIEFIPDNEQSGMINEVFFS